MFLPHELNALMGRIRDQLGQETGSPAQGTPPPAAGQNGNDSSSAKPSPLQNTDRLLVIAGLLTGVLNVDSILVAKDQHIEIVLTGSLKRRTELDKMLDKVGPMPFDDVMKAIMDRVNQ